jgi:Skp family chaperone for outer membrane proteins
MMKMTRYTKNLSLKAAVAGVVLSAAFFASPASAQQQPQSPRIAIVEMDRVLQESKVGKDIKRQLDGFAKAADGEFKSRSDALKAEQGKLAQQGAILSASAKAQKEKEFKAKVASFEADFRKRQQLIQGGQYQALQVVRKKLGDIVQAAMKARGANLLMEKAAFVAIQDPDKYEITKDLIQRLDQAMPALKVNLTPLPPEILAAAQRQAQMQAAQQQQQQR